MRTKSLHRVKRQHFFSSIIRRVTLKSIAELVQFSSQRKAPGTGGFSGQLNVDEENGRVADVKTIRLNASFLHGRRWPPGGFLRMAGSKNRPTDSSLFGSIIIH
jgi:hypothetical protein